MKQRHLQALAAFALLAIAIAYRLCTGLFGNGDEWLPNFAPVAAIALCGAIFLGKRVALFLPLAALFLSDIVLDVHYGVSFFGTEMLSRYVALGLVVAMGWALRERPRFLPVLAASFAGSALFYVITNTSSWIGSPLYAKSFAGWAQALTTGLPGYPSTLVFYRNTLVSDLLFTGLFLVCMSATQQREANIPHGERLEPITP